MILYLQPCFCRAAKFFSLLTCKIGHNGLMLATAVNVHCMHDVFAAAAAFFSDVPAKTQKQQASFLEFMGLIR